VKRVFKGRVIIRGNLEGEALVTRSGFNAYASFYNSIHQASKEDVCADSGNLALYGKILTGKIVCLPKTIGSTSAGAVWQRVARLGIAPKAMLFSQRIDSLAAGGLIIADIWADYKICTIDQLGDEFLATVKDDDLVTVHTDGTVEIR